MSFRMGESPHHDLHTLNRLGSRWSSLLQLDNGTSTGSPGPESPSG